MPTTPIHPVSLAAVQLNDALWSPRLQLNRQVTLPTQHRLCQMTGRIDAWLLAWKEGQPNRPHIFWDSDVAKWIEAAAYSLATFPDPRLEASIDQVIDLMAAAQADDGYLNSYFLQLDTDQRWTNLRDRHELYCAGHLIEAAVAYRQATGKTRFLDIMCRYADHIARTFGPAPGQKPGYPGHEEIELALVKLYRATGTRRYLDLATFFIDQRGRQPHYYTAESIARGEPPREPYDYCQAHLPVREQTAAEGHAVRACYLYAGMADVAAETGDTALLDACRTLFDNLTQRRMYVTGGVGSAHHGERFTIDYDLPNEEAYAETCAAIALVFFAHRMLQVEPDARYADVIERALYNGILSGISLDGKKYFYVNPLAQHPAAFRYHKWVTERQEWFGCACCPPNIARLFASLPTYFYSHNEREIYVHLYASGDLTLGIGGQPVRLTLESDYPWDGRVQLSLATKAPSDFTLALRLPGWCRTPMLAINGEPCSIVSDRGYLKLARQWEDGDTIALELPMPIERLAAHPHVRHNCGKVALQRGPIVYCFEEADNGDNLADLILPDRAPLALTHAESPFPHIPAITARARRRDPGEWQHALYAPVRDDYYDIPILAIPYAWWANRTPGEMIVWINRT